jgi:hypothetical protein
LVAEQLFASGCRLPVSVTSAGQITPIGPPPYFVLIDRALRDEGTSYHYLAGSTFAEAPDSALLARVGETIGAQASIALHRGATWPTDAPYRRRSSGRANWPHSPSPSPKSIARLRGRAFATRVESMTDKK